MYAHAHCTHTFDENRPDENLFTQRRTQFDEVVRATLAMLDDAAREDVDKQNTCVRFSVFDETALVRVHDAHASRWQHAHAHTSHVYSNACA